MKIISFTAARQLRYIRLCMDLGWCGGAPRDERSWGDTAEGSHYESPRKISYPTTGRFMLVERGRYGKTWVTLHDGARAAGEANVNQEYAEDWTDAEVIDLANGQHYQIEHRPVLVPLRSEGDPT